MHRPYKMAHGYLSFIEILGILWIILGVVAAWATFDGFNEAWLLTFVAWISGGVFMVTIAQLGRAVLHTSENTAGMLEVLKAQQVASNGYRPTQAASPNSVPSGAALVTEEGQRIKLHRGVPIFRKSGQIWALGVQHQNVIEAERFIESKAG